MGTALIYLLVVVGVAAAFFGVAVLVFGRGEELPPLAPDATPTRLPAREVGAEHVRALRFPLVLRGYRMTEVDWVLDRLATELDRAEGERDALLARIAELETGAAGAAGPSDGTPDGARDGLPDGTPGGATARGEPGSARID